MKKNKVNNITATTIPAHMLQDHILIVKIGDKNEIPPDETDFENMEKAIRKILEGHKGWSYIITGDNVSFKTISLEGLKKIKKLKKETIRSKNAITSLELKERRF